MRNARPTHPNNAGAVNRCSPLAVVAIALATLTAQARTVTVTPDPQSPTGGIQEAIESLGPEGGAVIIPAGTYKLRRPVMLRDRLTLRGEGRATILQPDAEFQTPLVEDMQTGDTSVRVEDASRWRVGDAIAVISDEHHMGYQAAFAVVTGIDGDTLELDRARTPDKFAYRVEDSARAVHTFSPLRTPRRGFQGGQTNHPTDLVIRDLTLLGTDKPAGYSNWYVNCGAYLAAERLTVEHVAVRNTPADGLYLSNHGRYIVRANFVESVGGHGIHFGDNAQQIIIRDNIIEKPAGDGIYLCWGGQRVIVAGNLITDAGQSGIGGVGAGGNMDRYANITDNVIRGSGRYGIEFLRNREDERPARSINITGNVLHDNQQVGVWLFSAAYINLSDNTITGSNTAIAVAGSDACQVTNNLLHGNRCAIRIQTAELRHGGAEPSTRNVIRGNTLIDNAVAIDDQAGNNTNILRDNIIETNNQLSNRGKAGDHGRQ